MALEAEEMELPDFLKNSSEDEIHEKMLGNLPEDIDKSEGGFPWDFTRPTAIEISELKEYVLVEVLKSMFPVTCEESYILDFHSEERGIVRRESVNASGYVSVTGKPGLIIPLGYGFSTDADDDGNTIDFVSTEEVTIDSLGNAKIPIEATEGGSESNVGANVVVLHTGDETGELLEDITSVSNDNPITGGLDEESDDTLRERIVTYDRSQSNSFIGNPSDYKRWAMSVAGVGAVTVISAEDTSGTVKIVILDQNGDPASKSIQDDVYDYIMSPYDKDSRLAPINAVLSIVTPVTLKINISAKVYLKGIELKDVESTFRNKVQEYLLNNALEDLIVRVSAISDLLYSIDGVYDYENVTINGYSKNLTIDSGQVPVLGTITLEGS
jgi:uncharacterized phage protein gp47/JayE